MGGSARLAQCPRTHVTSGSSARHDDWVTEKRLLKKTPRNVELQNQIAEGARKKGKGAVIRDPRKKTRFRYSGIAKLTKRGRKLALETNPDSAVASFCGTDDSNGKVTCNSTRLSHGISHGSKRIVLCGSTSFARATFWGCRKVGKE